MRAGQGRVVRVALTDLHFASIEHLEARIEATKQKLLEIERSVLARDPRDAEGWRLVEHHASELRDLLFGHEAWVEEEEAALDLEIEQARESIRAFGT